MPYLHCQALTFNSKPPAFLLFFNATFLFLLLFLSTFLFSFLMQPSLAASEACKTHKVQSDQ